MSEQIHHKSTHEVTQALQETAPVERPLTGLYISRTARDGAPSYMDGGWSVLGRQTVDGTEYTRVMQPTGTKDEQGKDLFHFKDIPTDVLYEQHFGEVERLRAEREAALGEGAVEAVEMIDETAVTDSAEKPAMEKAEVEEPAPEVVEKAEVRALTPDERQELAQKWSAMIDGLDTGRVGLEADRQQLRRAQDPRLAQDLIDRLSYATPSRSLSELRSDVMRTYSGRGDDTWLPAVARPLTAMGNVPAQLADNLRRARSLQEMDDIMSGAIRHLQRQEEQLRETLAE